MEHPIIGFGVDELARFLYENKKLSIKSLDKRKNGIGEAIRHILYNSKRLCQDCSM
jgi:hypothetical protein